MANSFPTGGTDKNIVICGGWSETNDATEEIQQISVEVKPQVETLTGKNYVEYKAVKYRSQLMYGGHNFLIKVYAGEEDYLHVMVSKGPLGGDEPALKGVEQQRTKDSLLNVFTNSPNPCRQ